MESFKVVAKYAYVAKRDDELSFAKKESLVVLDRQEDKGWWLAENAKGCRGLVPSTYVVTAAPAVVAPVAAPAPVEVVAAPAPTDFSSDWERRAVTAEKALSELLGVVEHDRIESDNLVAKAQLRVVEAEAQTRAAEDRALELAAALEKVEAERQNVQSSSSGGSSDNAELARRVAELEGRELELEREAEAERDAHREASNRAAELFDQYEAARAAVQQLQDQLADARRETDEVFF